MKASIKAEYYIYPCETFILSFSILYDIHLEDGLSSEIGQRKIFFGVEADTTAISYIEFFVRADCKNVITFISNDRLERVTKYGTLWWHRVRSASSLFHHLKCVLSLCKYLRKVFSASLSSVWSLESNCNLSWALICLAHLSLHLQNVVKEHGRHNKNLFSKSCLNAVFIEPPRNDLKVFVEHDLH
jgi:hypothetical protein